MSAANHGFTLLELLIVLALISLIVGVSLPYLRFGGIDAATGAHDLAGTLSAARARALTTRRPVTLAIDAQARRYGIDGAGDHALAQGLSLSWSLPGAANMGPIGTITFFPDGGSTGGQVMVSGRGRDAGVTVDWLTGGIRRVP